MIRLLWATIRPYTFIHTYSIWKNRMTSNEMTTYVAVNTEEDAKIVKDVLAENDKVIVVKTDKKGVCYPCYMLSSQLEADNSDVVVFASDDYIPPTGWDSYLIEKLKDREGGLLINDGYQALDFSNMADPIIGLPVMTHGCLLKLNRIIYNPVYSHLCSDAELFLNLKEMNLLIDERSKDNVIFEHLHWSAGKRQPDVNDQSYYNNFEMDKKTWDIRKMMPLKDRLNTINKMQMGEIIKND